MFPSKNLSLKLKQAAAMYLSFKKVADGDTRYLPLSRMGRFTSF
jgi:hypothetical protein